MTVRSRVTCFLCGEIYLKNKVEICPRCGESRTYVAKQWDPNYDFTLDPNALGKIRMYVAVGTILALAFVFLAF